MSSSKKYTYRVSTEKNKEKFYFACKTLEKNLPAIKKEPIFSNMFNGSMFQKYFLEDKEIKVCNDAEIGAVYIESEVLLPEAFGWERI